MVITFTEYALRQEYSNLIDQWEQMRLHDGFVFSEADDPMGRYGLRSAAQSLGQGMRNLGQDAMQAAKSKLASLSSSAMSLIKRKADELMSMGMERLQAYLTKNGHPDLLAKLNKYKNGLMILGVIAAGGLMALSGGKTLDPNAINDALQMPRGTYEQMDKETQKQVLEGLKLTKQSAELNQDINTMQKDLNKFFTKYNR